MKINDVYREIYTRFIATSSAPPGTDLFDDAIAKTALGYSGRVDWPPLESTFLFDDD